MNKYFLKRNEKVYGPYSIEQLKKGLNSKKISAHELAGLSETGPWLAIETWLKNGDAESVTSRSAMPQASKPEESPPQALAPQSNSPDPSKIFEKIPKWIKATAGFLVVILLTYSQEGCPFSSAGSNAVQAKLVSGEWISVDDSNLEKLAGWISYKFRPDGTVTRNILGTPLQGTYSVSGNTVTTNIQGRSESWEASFSGAYMYAELPDRKIRFIGGR